MASAAGQGVGNERPGALSSSSSDPSRSSRSPPATHPSESTISNRQEVQTSIHEPFPHQDLEKGIVGWDGPSDPENPRSVSTTCRSADLTERHFRNWPARRKWTVLLLVSSMTLIRFVGVPKRV